MLLLIVFCIRSRISPIPNSIADKTKKKNVKERMFKLSYIKPINKVIAYIVIHNNSAVSNKWSDVLVFMTILNSINKKNKKNKFMLSTINLG